MARLMGAHLLLTALLLSAHLFHTEARLAQARRSTSGGRGRVEAGPETDGDTTPDAWDRRRLLDAPPSPPAISAGGIAGITVAALVAAVGLGLMVRRVRKKAEAKRQATERAVGQGVDAAVANVEAGQAADAAAAAKATEDKAKAKAKQHADFLAALEASAVEENSYVPPENAAALKESISTKLAARPPAKLTAEEEAYISGLRDRGALYSTLNEQLIAALDNAPPDTKAELQPLLDEARKTNIYELDQYKRFPPAMYVQQTSPVFDRIDGAIKQATAVATKANDEAKVAAADASKKAQAADAVAKRRESKAAVMDSVRRISAGKLGGLASKDKLEAKAKELDRKIWVRVIPVISEELGGSVLGESLSKSEVRTSQASSVDELGQLLIDNSPEWGSAIEEPFDRSFANSVGQAQWDEVFMADNDNGKLSQEEILKRQKVAELDRQLSVVQQEREANIQKQLAAEDKRQAAVKSGNAEDRKAAEKEQAALEEEAKKLADKKDALEKKRAAEEEGRRG